MSALSGSIKKVTLDGNTFDASADADFGQKLGDYTKEIVPTSGRNMIKLTKQAKPVESVDLICDAEEKELVSELADRHRDFPLSYRTADGTIYRSTGQITIESSSTQDNKVSIQLLPRWNSWEAFIA